MNLPLYNFHYGLGRLQKEINAGIARAEKRVADRAEYVCNECNQKMTEEEVEDIAGKLPEHPENHTYICQNCLNYGQEDDRELEKNREYREREQIT